MKPAREIDEKRRDHGKSGFNFCAQQLAILKENERHWKIEYKEKGVCMYDGTINRWRGGQFRQSASTGKAPPPQEGLGKGRTI